MLLNLKKCLDHLKQYSRVDTRYLWCAEEIFRGDEEVIWGLVNTVYNSFHSKAVCVGLTTSALSVESVTTEETLVHSTQSTQRKGRRLSEEQTRALNSRSRSPIARVANPYSQLYSTAAQSRSATPTIKHLNKSLYSSIRSSSSTHEVTNCITPNKNTANEDMRTEEADERLTRVWLRSLNFTTTRSQEDEPLLKNPFRNGTLLCEVVWT